MELQVGSILEGKVTSITKFGAFVALDNGKSGLVHISEIANTFVNDVHDYLQEGTVFGHDGTNVGIFRETDSSPDAASSDFSARHPASARPSGAGKRAVPLFFASGGK